MKIDFSGYLTSQGANLTLLNKVAEVALLPVLNEYNAESDRPIKAEFDMNAKTQRISLSIFMEDDAEMSVDASNFAVWGLLADVVKAWFGVEMDEEDDYVTELTYFLGIRAVPLGEYTLN